MKTRYSIELLGVELRFFFGVRKKLNAWKTGITNRCGDGQFVLFLDYDRTPLEWILDELHYLIEHHKLGDVYVFKTGKGYHVVNTEKRSFYEIVQIMQATSCDPNYLMVPMKFGKRAWTLRVSNKKGKPTIQHIWTIKGHNSRVQSAPHNELLRKLYGVRIRHKKEDGEKDFYKSTYLITE